MTVRLYDGMRGLAPRYDGFILDLWGVVHDGTAPFPGVLDCMRRLLDAGKRLVCCRMRRAAPTMWSAASPRSACRPGSITASCRRARRPGCVCTVATSRSTRPWGDAAYRLAPSRDLEIREGLDLDFVDDPAAADFILNTGPAEWDDTVEDYAPVLHIGARTRPADGVRQPRPRRDPCR